MYPYLLHSRHLYLPTFAVAAALGLMLTLALSQRTAKLAGVPPDALWDAGLFALGAAFVLSRLLLLAANLRTFLAFPLLLLAVPSLTGAGLALTIAATFLWLKVHKLPMLNALDAWAPCGALLWAFLALGHFAEGSDPGLPTQSPFGLRAGSASTASHPVALYAAVTALLLSAALYLRLQRRWGHGEIAGFALTSVGTAQFLLSFLRQPGSELVWGLEALQWVALAMIVAGGLLLATSTASSTATHATHAIAVTRTHD